MSIRASVMTAPKAPLEIWDLGAREFEPANLLFETAIGPERYGLD